MTEVINFFGAPSSGKTTCAAKAYTYFKELGKSAILVQEYATEVILEGNKDLVKNQRVLFEEQLRRIERAYNKVDYIVVDSPLLLNIVYKRFYNRPIVDSFETYVREWNSKFQNTNIFLSYSNMNFDTNCRVTTAEDNVIIEKLIKDVLDENQEFYYTTTKEEFEKNLFNFEQIGTK